MHHEDIDNIGPDDVWPPAHLAEEQTVLSTAWTTPSGSGMEQPGFGVAVQWNHPRRLGRPFVTRFLWRWRLSIGWLFSGAGAER